MISFGGHLLGQPGKRRIVSSGGGGGGGSGTGSAFIEAVPVGTDAFVDFLSIPQTHRHLRIQGYIGSTSGTVTVRLRVNGQTGNIYHCNQIYAAGSTPTSTCTVNDAGGSKLGVCGAAYHQSQVVIDMMNYTFTLLPKTAMSSLVTEEASAGVLARYTNSLAWGAYGDANTLAPITSLRLYVSAGTMVVGVGGSSDVALTLQLIDPFA